MAHPLCSGRLTKSNANRPPETYRSISRQIRSICQRCPAEPFALANAPYPIVVRLIIRPDGAVAPYTGGRSREISSSAKL
ncbi:hypothetical protein GWI33_014986 [Rhynchophorus ferrugineus]|uniref:Uncharacterized protein n=1 Tax=Rhynchophorus ferrugineus TaxID=354439 RepID=A0A834I434_RHYFE|nr:hypothetical protein GWI33_014986 [Rhynchophorus ferrugineus]